MFLKLFVLRVISLSLLCAKKTHTGAGLTSLDTEGGRMGLVHALHTLQLGRLHIFLGPGHMASTAWDRRFKADVFQLGGVHDWD